MNLPFLILPYCLIQDDELTMSASVLMAEIISLSKKEGYCYASNAWLAKELNMSERAVKTGIAKLKKLCYINSKTSGKSRRLYPCMSMLCENADRKENAKPARNEGKTDTSSGQILHFDRANSAHNNKRENKKDKYSYNSARGGYDFMDYSERSYDLEELEKIV